MERESPELSLIVIRYSLVLYFLFGFFISFAEKPKWIICKPIKVNASKVGDYNFDRSLSRAISTFAKERKIIIQETDCPVDTIAKIKISLSKNTNPGSVNKGNGFFIVPELFYGPHQIELNLFKYSESDDRLVGAIQEYFQDTILGSNGWDLYPLLESLEKSKLNIPKKQEDEFYSLLAKSLASGADNSGKADKIEAFKNTNYDDLKPEKKLSGIAISRIIYFLNVLNAIYPFTPKDYARAGGIATQRIKSDIDTIALLREYPHTCRFLNAISSFSDYIKYWGFSENGHMLNSRDRKMEKLTDYISALSAIFDTEVLSRSEVDMWRAHGMDFQKALQKFVIFKLKMLNGCDKAIPSFDKVTDSNLRIRCALRLLEEGCNSSPLQIMSEVAKKISKKDSAFHYLDSVSVFSFYLLKLADLNNIDLPKLRPDLFPDTLPSEVEVRDYIRDFVKREIFPNSFQVDYKVKRKDKDILVFIAIDNESGVYSSSLSNYPLGYASFVGIND